jgi:hypothetical protein
LKGFPSIIYRKDLPGALKLYLSKEKGSLWGDEASRTEGSAKEASKTALGAGRYVKQGHM